METIRDSIAILGLGLIGIGLWWWEPAWCLVVIGGLLLGGIVLPRICKARRGNDDSG